MQDIKIPTCIVPCVETEHGMRADEEEKLSWWRGGSLEKCKTYSETYTGIYIVHRTVQYSIYII